MQALDYDGRQAAHICPILTALCTDTEVICYRQEVFADISGSQSLQRDLAALLPTLRELDEIRRYSARSEDNELLQVVRRLRELELYVEAGQRLLAVLEAAAGELHARGLRLLHERLVEMARSEEFARLLAELPGLRATMQKLSSVTIGVNLDEQARPVAATLLSVNDLPFTGKRGLLARILGKQREDIAGAGIAPLHAVAAHSPSPFLQPIFRDLGEVLRLVCQPVAQTLGHYVHVSVTPLSSLAPEIAFYLGAARLAERFRSAGLPLCRPVMLANEERASHITDLYNVNLAVRLLSRPAPVGQPSMPIPSDLDMGKAGRNFVLTGPNMGGKTTYVQAVGLAHVLAQAGLFVPGRSAEISVVDAIYTHFPEAEHSMQASGRLGEEAQRLARIFSEATPYSLILLNESLSSTSPGESLYLARDVLCALRLLGARAIYATHLHELAARLDEVNALAGGEPPALSLVAGIVPPEERSRPGDLGRTYRIVLGPPQGTSYAEEVAQRHGISLAQLQEKLRQRGILADR